MIQTIDAAMERARDLLDTPRNKCPPSVNAFIAELKKKCLFDPSCLQGQLTAFVRYAQAVEKLPCNHPTYGLASLSEPIRKIIEEIGEKVVKQSPLNRIESHVVSAPFAEEQTYNFVAALPSTDRPPTYPCY